MTVCAIIPTKNEAPSIGKLIDCLKGYVDEITVIDGNSPDGTYEIVKSHGAEIFKGDGGGKGHDLKLFQKHIQKHPQHADIYIMMDGDMSYDPKDIPRIIKPIEENKADVVIGSRHDKIKPEPGATRNINRFGNKVLTYLANFLYQAKRGEITDICSGYWAFSENFFANVPLSAEGFDLECDIFNHARRNYRFKTVPTRLRKRIGHPKLSLPNACKIPLYFMKYYTINLLSSQNKTD